MRLNDQPIRLPVPGQKPATTIEATAAEQRTIDSCRKFEGFLLGEMLKTMRSAESESKGVIPVSRAERIFIGQQCEVLGDILGRTEPLAIRALLASKTRPAPPAEGTISPLALPERGQP